MKSWLENTYVFNPPTPIPRDLLSPGSRYNVVIRLCNFLGACSQGSHQFTVLRSIKPMVSIPGLRRKRIKSNEPMKLTSSANIAHCSSSSSSSGGGNNGNGNSNITITTEGLEYNWVIVKDGEVLSSPPSPSLVSLSKDPSILILPA